MEESDRYIASSLKKEREWEALCRRCGSCCGAFEDPCQHLKPLSENRFYCAVYDNRFGLRMSMTGRTFRCVPIRDILYKSWQNDYLCPYKKGPGVSI